MDKYDNLLDTLKNARTMIRDTCSVGDVMREQLDHHIAQRTATINQQIADMPAVIYAETNMPTCEEGVWDMRDDHSGVAVEYVHGVLYWDMVSKLADAAADLVRLRAELVARRDVQPERHGGSITC